jgi:transposase InsO family protein
MNEPWQMDFKGRIAMDRDRCHPLTMLDDHSRYAIGVIACADETVRTGKARLTDLFRRHGL